ncbi:MAG TPA: hypothetical protein VFX21_07640, partial [Acidimicrobiia bacterium]|nr:hypothetical protein [Acidimicrobiia bacterium]
SRLPTPPAGTAGTATIVALCGEDEAVDAASRALASRPDVLVVVAGRPRPGLRDGIACAFRGCDCLEVLGALLAAATRGATPAGGER